MLSSIKKDIPLWNLTPGNQRDFLSIFWLEYYNFQFSPSISEDNISEDWFTLWLLSIKIFSLGKLFQRQKIEITRDIRKYLFDTKKVSVFGSQPLKAIFGDQIGNLGRIFIFLLFAIPRRRSTKMLLNWQSSSKQTLFCWNI